MIWEGGTRERLRRTAQVGMRAGEREGGTSVVVFLQRVRGHEERAELAFSLFGRTSLEVGLRIS